MPLPRFGFEAEFNTDITPLVVPLYNGGFATTTEVHPWHCHCDTCDFRRIRAFHFQTDSSCGGEVITRIFDSTGAAFTDACYALQKAAVDHDVEPGQRAGFHVHVETAHVPAHLRILAFGNFRRWEGTLMGIGGGVVTTNRGFNQSLANELCEFDMHSDSEAFDYHYDNDRHSNLCVSTEHGTWEFRLWNSTRSAWRMRLYVQLSRLWLAEADAIAGIANPRSPYDYDGGSARDLADCLHNLGHFTAAADLRRQLDYRETAQRHWPQLTV